jgi:hypothetical protein
MRKNAGEVKRAEEDGIDSKHCADGKQANPDERLPVGTHEAEDPVKNLTEGHGDNGTNRRISRRGWGGQNWKRRFAHARSPHAVRTDALGRSNAWDGAWLAHCRDEKRFAEIIVENAASVRMHIGQNVAIEEGLLRQATAVAQIDMHFDAT